VSFSILFTTTAEEQLNELKDSNPKKHKKALKTLGLLEINPKHPGLNTHKYSSIRGHNGEEVFEAYVENKTPAAYRIFFHYGPGKSVITIIAITPHP
jgi:mRNA-degrading endonuclease RelE of RelBE toxin-antitoxin system